MNGLDPFHVALEAAVLRLGDGDRVERAIELAVELLDGALLRHPRPRNEQLPGELERRLGLRERVSPGAEMQRH